MHPACKSCEFRRGQICTKAKGVAGLNLLQSCPIGLFGRRVISPPALPSSSSSLPSYSWPDSSVIAPYRTGEGKRYEGSAPWRNKQVSVILPILEYNVTLPLVLEGIRRQTVPSVIYLIDTGSILTTEQILSLRSPDIEVIQLRLQGWYHPSWPVAAALDAAWACINTPFCFFTHDDCFLKKQTTFEELIPLAKRHHVVGHQITERPYPGWKLEFGHTFLMLRVDTMDQIGMSWNLRTYGRQTGCTIDPRLGKPNEVDTERLMNLKLAKAGFVPSFQPVDGQPLFTGTETNQQRNEDSWIDHCRSMTCGFLYSPDHTRKVNVWVEAAMQEALARMESWR